jgi:hypothetical protein
MSYTGNEPDYQPGEQASQGIANATEAATLAQSKTLTLVAGTAQQDTLSHSSTVALSFTGGASGTFTVAVGPTSAASTVLFNAVPCASGSEALTVPLPAGWWIKVSVGGSCTIASSVQISG